MTFIKDQCMYFMRFCSRQLQYIRNMGVSKPACARYNRGSPYTDSRAIRKSAYQVASDTLICVWHADVAGAISLVKLTNFPQIL